MPKKTSSIRRDSDRRRPAALCLILCAALVSGCGDGRLSVHPVQGRVAVDGEPAEGIQFILFPVQPFETEAATPLPTGFSDAAGNFTVSTYEGGDGAPLGEYRVSAVWKTELAEGADPEAVDTVDQLGGRYGDPDLSGLTLTVQAGDEVIHAFDLTRTE